MSFIKNILKFKVETPSGFHKFEGIQKIQKDKYCHIIFIDGTELKCSINHRVQLESGEFLTADKLVVGNSIRTKLGKEKIISSWKIVNESIFLYDLMDVDNGNIFYTNDVVSHNCNFIGSQNTLISSKILKELAWKHPLQKTESISVYEEPRPEGIYMITVDCSEGQNKDYSAFSVIDCTEFPYKQVCCYRSKTIEPVMFPTFIFNAAKKYNDAYVLVENNTIGSQVVDTLHSEMEYENIFASTPQGRGGQQLSTGFKKGSKLGVRTTMTLKRVACSNLKSLIENKKLLLEDFDTISELTTFVADRQSFRADTDKNDDMVMTLVIFSWLNIQPLFKELTDNDLRKKMYEQKVNSLQEQMVPFGIISNGEPEKDTFVDAKGDVLWEVVGEEDDFQDDQEY